MPRPSSCCAHPRFPKRVGLFGYSTISCADCGVKPSTIRPPALINPCISLKPVAASARTCIELIARSLSKELSSKGNLSDARRQMLTLSCPIVAAFRKMACSTISVDGSMSEIGPFVSELIRSLMPTPNSEPTSRILLIGRTSSKSTIQATLLRIPRDDQPTQTVESPLRTAECLPQNPFAIARQS